MYIVMKHALIILIFFNVGCAQLGFKETPEDVLVNLSKVPSNFTNWKLKKGFKDPRSEYLRDLEDGRARPIASYHIPGIRTDSDFHQSYLDPYVKQRVTSFGYTSSGSTITRQRWTYSKMNLNEHRGRLYYDSELRRYRKRMSWER